MVASSLNRILLALAGVLGLLGLCAGIVMWGIGGDLLRVVFFAIAVMAIVVALVARRNVTGGG